MPVIVLICAGLVLGVVLLSLSLENAPVLSVARQSAAAAPLALALLIVL